MFVFNLCEETISRTDEGQPRPKYIFNKCGTNIYFFTLQRFCELSKVSKLNAFILPAPETRRTLMHLFLFTNTAQRELVSICTQRIRNSNYLSLPYYLHLTNQRNTKLIFKKKGLKLWNQIHNPGSIRKQIFV